MLDGIGNRVNQVMGRAQRPADLRVEVIGMDGIRRVGYCSRTETMAFNKYQVDAEGVFLTEYADKEGNLQYEPTIAFYENSTVCIKEGERSDPTPKEAGEAISQASFSLARLMRAEDAGREKLMLYLTIGALVAAALAAVMAFKMSGDISALGNLLEAAPVVSGTVPTPLPTMPKV